MVHWFIFTASFVLTLALIPSFVYLAAMTAAALGGAEREGRICGWDRGGEVQICIRDPGPGRVRYQLHRIEFCNDVDYPREQFRRRRSRRQTSTDRTAERAQLAGAEVLERTDLERRGKGFALKYFFRAEPPDRADQDYDAVVIIDADTKVDRSILTAFGRESPRDRIGSSVITRCETPTSRGGLA